VIISKLLKATLLMVGLISLSTAYAYKPIYLDRLNETGMCNYCNLRDADLSNRTFKDAQLSESKLEGANFSKSVMIGVWFTRSHMQKVNLQGADVTNALMDYTLLNGANLQDANLSGAYLNFADLTDANLKGAKLDGAKLRGVTYCNTTMPDGSINNDNC
jgi:uncharacterized protein YjbI with pentapeptide repeats